MDRLTRVGVIHGSQLFRECLVSVFARKYDEFQVVELKHECKDIGALLAAQEVDVILLDLSLPDNQALDIAMWIRERLPLLRVVALVSAKSQDRLAEHAAAGCHAWVHEESPLEELVTALRDLRSGKAFCSSALTRILFTQFSEMAREAPWQRHGESSQLTPRELQILDLVSLQLSNKQIARRLSVSLFTVKNHVHNILDKLSVSSRHDAVQYARRNRWLR